MSNLPPDPLHCRVTTPSLALLQLMHESFPDPLSRCTAVVAEVFSRWRFSGQALTPGPPSILLVNCGPQEHDREAAFFAVGTMAAV